MRLFVKTTYGKTIVVIVEDSRVKVGKLKEMLENKTSIPMDQQRLIFVGKQLENEMSLGDYHIEAEHTLYMVLKLRGD